MRGGDVTSQLCADNRYHVRWLSQWAVVRAVVFPIAGSFLASSQVFAVPFLMDNYAYIVVDKATGQARAALIALTHTLQRAAM